MPEQTYASFASEDLREQSNLWDNVDARITDFQFTKVAPPNYTTEGGDPIFAVITFLIDGDAPEAERSTSQSYSLGASAGSQFAISNDGHGLIPLTADSVVRKGSKFTTLTASFEEVGLNKTLLKTGDFGKLIGFYGHWMRKPDQPRTFVKDQLTSRKDRVSKFPPSTLVLTKILAMPGEVAAAAVPAKGKGNGKAAAAPANAAVPGVTETGDLDSDTMEYLLLALKNAKGTLQRGQLTLAIGRAAGTTNPNRANYAKRAFDEGFLNNLAGMGIIVYEQTKTGQPISLPASN